MYNDNDLEEAVAAGILAPEAVAAFRSSIAASRGLPRVDEEHYRVFDGGNDGFVVVGAILTLAGLGSLGWLIEHSFAGIVVAAGAWALAEYFVRVRRLTATGIILSFAFFGGVIATMVLLLVGSQPDPDTGKLAIIGAVIAAITAGAMWGFWLRFRAPIAVSFVALGAAGAVILLALAVVGGSPGSGIGWVVYGIAFLCGIGVFAFAMWWDQSDRDRVTLRHEVALWTHGVAGALIAQSLFYLIGATGMSFYFVTTSQVVMVLVLYLIFAVVALAIDRRALLSSSIGALIYALAGMLLQAGLYTTALGLALAIAGGAMLLLSAYWHPARRAIVPLLGGLADRLPPVADRVTYEDVF